MKQQSTIKKDIKVLIYLFGLAILIEQFVFKIVMNGRI